MGLTSIIIYKIFLKMIHRLEGLTLNCKILLCIYIYTKVVYDCDLRLPWLSALLPSARYPTSPET